MSRGDVEHIDAVFRERNSLKGKEQGGVSGFLIFVVNEEFSPENLKEEVWKFPAHLICFQTWSLSRVATGSYHVELVSLNEVASRALLVEACLQEIGLTTQTVILVTDSLSAVLRLETKCDVNWGDAAILPDILNLKFLLKSEICHLIFADEESNYADVYTKVFPRQNRRIARWLQYLECGELVLTFSKRLKQFEVSDVRTQKQFLQNLDKIQELVGTASHARAKEKHAEKKEPKASLHKEI